MSKWVFGHGRCGLAGRASCERRLAAGSAVLCVDRYFTGTKRIAYSLSLTDTIRRAGLSSRWP